MLAIQQRVGDRDIANIGCRALDVVHQPGEFINADVRLHPEVPLVALAGLMHFRVARLVGVLGRAERVVRSDRAGAAADDLAGQLSCGADPDTNHGRAGAGVVFDLALCQLCSGLVSCFSEGLHPGVEG